MPQLPTITVVTPCEIFGSMSAFSIAAASSCVWTSMKPGATTRPVQSISSHRALCAQAARAVRAASGRAPRPRRCARRPAARRPASPALSLPSTIVPPLSSVAWPSPPLLVLHRHRSPSKVSEAPRILGAVEAVLVQQLLELLQSARGDRPELLRQPHHQDLDHHQVRQIGFGADPHHRVLRHRHREHQVRDLGQRRAGLRQRHHGGALRAREARGLQRVGHAADVRDHEGHAIGSQRAGRDQLLVGIEDGVGGAAQPEQPALQLVGHEGRGRADRIAVDRRASASRLATWSSTRHRCGGPARSARTRRHG